MTQQHLAVGPAPGSAVISPCGLYRYELRRSITVHGGQPHGRRVCWLMLNPSTADAEQDDPTMRKVLGFSRRWGYEEIVVVNLYAWRATDPKAMLEIAAVQLAEAVGPDNDRHILAAAAEAEVVVLGWGANADHRRARDVLRMLEPHAAKLRCLKLTGNGHPGHPLMLPYKLPLVPWLDNYTITADNLMGGE